MTRGWGLYVHIPWCRAHCPYCGFHVVTDPVPPSQRFTDCAIQEIASRRGDYPGLASTLYLGGGTPSRLPLEALGKLIDAAPLAHDAEVTLEANPEDLDEHWCDAIVERGATRISLGVQSLQTHVSRRLGRAHTSRVARTALAHVQQAPLASWSVDLIFGVPGQSLEDLKRDLQDILEFEPPHVSLYGLTIEPGTRFEQAVRRKRMTPIEDDVWRTQYDLLVATLGEAGLERYEVSNFARPGHESRHNQAYWQDVPYMGIGPSAHGLKPDGVRYLNQPDTPGYLTRGGPTEETERPSRWQAAVDYLASAIRTREGADLVHLSQRHRHACDPSTILALTEQGWVNHNASRVRLTSEGFPMADAIAARLVDRLTPQ